MATLHLENRKKLEKGDNSFAAINIANYSDVCVVSPSVMDIFPSGMFL